MTNQIECKLSFQFIEPSESVMATARKLVASSNENCRSVAKAVLDVTAVGIAIKNALVEKRNVDLAPYFDFWFADAINCAEKLLHFEDEDLRCLAKSLIAMEKAAIKSKESFLAEMKHFSIKPS